jgi:hypothetical protein
VKRPLFIKNLYCTQRTHPQHVQCLSLDRLHIFHNFVYDFQFYCIGYIIQSLPKTKKVRLQTNENADALY